ncbi:unnamed protein product [Pleuronectes platessa]|uniref:Uncharacterized protein n=1 Tax=Pleuronectes platessa TaxID=8262 RepID=A0A9N7TXX0_PLEPL|nr:unnamed protein product [Pleuronectes platessa]
MSSPEARPREHRSLRATGWLSPVVNQSATPGTPVKASSSSSPSSLCPSPTAALQLVVSIFVLSVTYQHCLSWRVPGQWGQRGTKAWSSSQLPGQTSSCNAPPLPSPFLFTGSVPQS